MDKLALAQVFFFLPSTSNCPLLVSLYDGSKLGVIHLALTLHNIRNQPFPKQQTVNMNIYCGHWRMYNECLALLYTAIGNYVLGFGELITRVRRI